MLLSGKKPHAYHEKETEPWVGAQAPARRQAASCQSESWNPARAPSAPKETKGIPSDQLSASKKLECLLFQQLKQVSKMRDSTQGPGEESPKCLILAQIMKQLELQQYSTYLLDMKNLQKTKLKMPEWFDNPSYSKRKWW